MKFTALSLIPFAIFLFFKEKGAILDIFTKNIRGEKMGAVGSESFKALSRNLAALVLLASLGQVGTVGREEK